MGPSKAQPDHSGLQVNYSNEAPEVVHEMRTWAPTPQTSSHGKPEYYGPQSPGQESEDLMKPDIREYRGEPPQYYVPVDTKTGNKSDRRICGLRRRTFFILVAVIVLLVVIAAVLGAVLGVLLGSSSNDDS